MDFMIDNDFSELIKDRPPIAEELLTRLFANWREYSWLIGSTVALTLIVFGGIGVNIYRICTSEVEIFSAQVLIQVGVMLLPALLLIFLLRFWAEKLMAFGYKTALDHLSSLIRQEKEARKREEARRREEEEDERRLHIEEEKTGEAEPDWFKELFEDE